MPNTSFAILSGALDELEEIDATTPGGVDHSGFAVRAMEAAIFALSPAGDGLKWKFRRLVRALANGWDAEEVSPLCASILAEVRALAEDRP